MQFANADGLRTSKTINNVKFDYYWNDGKIIGTDLCRKYNVFQI